MQVMAAAGQTPPPSVPVTLLIDTGASSTCLDPTAIASLALTATGTVQIQTPSTGGAAHCCNQYDISLIIPSPAGAPHFIDALPIIEASLRPQGIDGLLGRDVLARCILFYNGPLLGYTLAY